MDKVKGIFGLISFFIFLFDLSHIIELVTHYNEWIASGIMDTAALQEDLTNSLLLMLPIIFVLVLVFKPDKH
jgi:hypothetical protein